MSDIKKITLLFEDNPISRAYIYFFKINNLLDNKLIYIKSKSIMPKLIVKNLTFNKNNFYPLKFLKNKSILRLIPQIEDYFSLERNFLISMYDYKNLHDFKNICHTKNDNINSKENLNFFSKFKEKNFLNTGKQILKDILFTKKNFYHIHPGYLPRIRGADASLHSINLNNKIGASLFLINEKIDEGKIILRDEKIYNKFFFSESSIFEYNDLYRIWFSFFDPAIRVWLLKKAIDQNIDLDKFLDLDINNEDKNYYTFFAKNELNIVFKKIFN